MNFLLSSSGPWTICDKVMDVYWVFFKKNYKCDFRELMAQGNRIVKERWKAGGVGFLQGKVAFNNGKTVLFLKFICLAALHWVSVSELQDPQSSLWYVGSLSYIMLNLSCGMWDLVSWPGIKPGAAAVGAWNLSLWITWEVSVRRCFKEARKCKTDHKTHRLSLGWRKTSFLGLEEVELGLEPEEILILSTWKFTREMHV